MFEYVSFVHQGARYLLQVRGRGSFGSLSRLAPVPRERARALLAEAAQAGGRQRRAILALLQLGDAQSAEGALARQIAQRFDLPPYFELLRELEPSSVGWLGAGRTDASGGRESAAPQPSRRPQSFVAFEVKTKQGAPLPGLRLSLESADGDVRTLVSDAQGLARADPIPPGSCRVRLPAFDAACWQLGGLAPTVVARGPSTMHTVLQGESLASIAQRHGYRAWQSVWEAGENRALRKRRKSPHVLLPGDRVWVQGVEIGEVVVASDSAHPLVLDIEVEVSIRVRLQALGEARLAGCTYAIRYTHRGQEVERAGRGPTDAGGALHERIPLGVEVIELLFDKPKLRVTLLVSHLDPLLEPEDDEPIESGLSARLRALGYMHTASEPESALRDFQQLEMQREEATGEPDRETLDKLEQVYGV